MHFCPLNVLVISTVCFLVSPFANAQDCPGPNNPANQLEMNFCAAEAFHQAEKSLQSVYQEIRIRVTTDPAFLAMLDSSTSSWAAYRDAQCNFALGPQAGGSSEPWARFTCKERLTRLRIDEMRAFLTCEEGSFLCGVPVPY